MLPQMPQFVRSWCTSIASGTLFCALMLALLAVGCASHQMASAHSDPIDGWTRALVPGADPGNAESDELGVLVWPPNSARWTRTVPVTFVEDAVGADALDDCRKAQAEGAGACSTVWFDCVTLVVFPRREPILAMEMAACRGTQGNRCWVVPGGEAGSGPYSIPIVSSPLAGMEGTSTCDDLPDWQH